MRLLIAEDDTRLLKSLKHIFEANQYYGRCRFKRYGCASLMQKAKNMTG